MKNISKQYQDLLEGKMSKDNFVRNCRQQFPQFVSPVTSVTDAIKILKSKRIIAEMIDFRQDSDLGGNDPVKQGYEDNISGYTLEDCPYKPGSEEMALWKDGWMDYESEKQMEHDEETYRRETGVDSADDEDKDAWSKLDGDDVHPAGFPGMTERLNEADNKTEGKWKEATGKDEYGRFKDLDNVNFTTFLRAVAFEVGQQSGMKDDQLPALLEKIAKKMKKDPNAYRELVVANYAEIAKQDEPLKMKEVKPGNMVDKDNGMKEIKGQEKLKAMSAPKSENKKGKPEGVKEMGIKPKSAPGIKQTMDLPGKEKVLETLINSLKKSLTEDTHHKYNKGTDVVTPDGSGVVTAIVGGTVTVKLKNDTEKDFQINTLDHFEKKAREEDVKETNNSLDIAEPMEIKSSDSMNTTADKIKGTMNESIIAAIALAILGVELLSSDAHGAGAISNAIQDIKLKFKGEKSPGEIWNKVAKDDEIKNFVKTNADDIIKQGKNYKSKELSDLVKNKIDKDSIEEGNEKSDWTVGEEIIGSKKQYFLYNQETGKRKGIYKSKEEAESNIKEGSFMGGVDLGGSFNKMKGQMTAEDEFNQLMSDYDWYAEMSDDPRKYDAQKDMEYKLKALAKSIGVDKAIQIWNSYAPNDRKITKTFFMESDKKDKYAKLKEFLKKVVKKEGINVNPKTNKAIAGATAADDAIASKFGYTKKIPANLTPLSEKKPK